MNGGTCTCNNMYVEITHKWVSILGTRPSGTNTSIPLMVQLEILVPQLSGRLRLDQQPTSAHGKVQVMLDALS